MSTESGPIVKFGRARLNAAGFLFVLVLLLMGIQWYQDKREFKTLRLQADTSRTQLMALDRRLEELQAQQQILDTRYQRFSQENDEAAIADIEQTLLIANQQLQVVGNVRSALYALQICDERLARGGEPNFAPLRKAFARDMTNLEQASTLDTTDIGERLDGVLTEIDTLPLAIGIQQLPKNSPSVTTPTKESLWRQLAIAAWREFRSLISIQDRNQTRMDAAVLGPEQIFLLRQNLKLRLLSARLAWLGRDAIDFKADLQAAQQMLDHYFALDNPKVAQLRILVRGLDGRHIDAFLPDLAGSLAALRDYRLGHPQS